MTDYRLYEQQLNFLEDILEFHPDFILVLNPEEAKIFEKYFLPDWDKVDNFRSYHKQLLKESPDIEKRANEIMEKFLEKNNIDHANLLPQTLYKK